VHDAVVYMTTVDELRSVAQTAFEHTRPGGAAVFAPDALRETFRDEALLHTGDDGGRSLRCIEWTWDPDPTDDTCTVDYAFLLRDGAGLRAVHDRHIEGLFSRALWQDVLQSAGYRVEMAKRRDEDRVDEVFLCQRP
jgi:hypothetical protein